MPVYDMICDTCGKRHDDVYFGRAEDRDGFVCRECANDCHVDVPRRMMINLDSTCAGWDEVMEVELRGKSHRKLEMQKRGIIERDKTPLYKNDKGKWV